jgi:hypothetical protein
MEVDIIVLFLFVGWNEGKKKFGDIVGIQSR